ncbi:GTP pyrophosphokinase [Actinidia chinensis var. chinensis]|uniref:GTP pyrophosphokinase n=1 Tax=Actinidia chinensis var. chinensis TaxID=1590841 RepID=A0A2R6RN96_ACTCC|nr:GTP pyrophosphokinase [Actinidia chinensis var. chinensis]
MNISISECSSGCESGWTMYLDQSSNSGDQLQKSGCGYEAANVEDYDEDEDLSMVSDASSGPPHFQEDEDLFDESGYVCSSVSEQPNKRKTKKKITEQRSKQMNPNLDDTASSPIKKHIAKPPNGASVEHTTGFSQGFSATHFKGKSTLQKKLGFLHSSVPGKPASGPTGRDLQ